MRELKEKFNNWVDKRRRKKEVYKDLDDCKEFWLVMTPLFIIGGYCMVQEIIVAIHNIGYLL